MTDENITQRGTARKLKKPLSEQMADARIRAATRAKRRKAAFEAVLKASGKTDETGNG